MVEVMGSMSLVWLVLWSLLTLVFRLCYPLIRGGLMRLRPDQGSLFSLAWWSAPLVISLLTSVLLFLPLTEAWLVDPHCHEQGCQQHVPLLVTPAIAWAGFAMAVTIVSGLLIHFFYGLLKGARLGNGFRHLSSQQNGYHLIDSVEPAVFTLGWWKPRVFLSQGLLEQCSSTELSVILDHELAHLRRRDNLRLLLGRVFTLLLPGRWQKNVREDMQLLAEEACDFAAATRHGALNVAETLLHVGRVLKHHVVPRPAVGFNHSELSLRVHALLQTENRKALRTWQLRALMFSLLLCLLMALDPLHHSAEWLLSLLDPATA